MAEAIKMGGGSVLKTDKIGYYSCKEGSIKAGTPVEFCVEHELLNSTPIQLPILHTSSNYSSGSMQCVTLDDGRIVLAYTGAQAIDTYVALINIQENGQIELISITDAIQINLRYDGVGAICAKNNKVFINCSSKLLTVIVNNDNTLSYSIYDYPEITVSNYTTSIYVKTLIALSDTKILVNGYAIPQSRRYYYSLCILEIESNTLKSVANVLLHSTYTTNDYNAALALTPLKQKLTFLSQHRADNSGINPLSVIVIDENLSTITIESKYAYPFFNIVTYSGYENRSFIYGRYSGGTSGGTPETFATLPYDKNKISKRPTAGSFYTGDDGAYGTLLWGRHIQDNIYATTISSNSNTAPSPTLNIFYLKDDVMHILDGGVSVYTFSPSTNLMNDNIMLVCKKYDTIIITVFRWYSPYMYYQSIKINIKVKKAESIVDGFAKNKITTDVKKPVYIL